MAYPQFILYNPTAADCFILIRVIQLMKTYNERSMIPWLSRRIKDEESAILNANVHVRFSYILQNVIITNADSASYFVVSLLFWSVYNTCAD